ncbi:MAG: creatininase family protein [Planctomycetaceae bacterium]|nr:creatininase family protein [Planctomycetaceae bacterium]
MLRLAAAAILLLLAAAPAAVPDPVNPDPNSPRPIEAVDSVFMEDLTWMEIRDSIRGGTDTVIVATGGVEQNGPYLVTGKHNVILRGVTEVIARKLGQTLVAPIVPFVPEGGIDPPTDHVRYPGTISVTEETYEGLLTDICGSLKAAGFRRIIILGDSGGNQLGMKNVADALTAKWAGGKTSVVYIPEFYDNAAITAYLETNGIHQELEGLHDDYVNTAQMMAVEPESVRMTQRIAAGNFRINGVELAPAEQTIEWGRKIFEFRAERTVAAIEARSGR